MSQSTHFVSTSYAGGLSFQSQIDQYQLKMDTTSEESSGFGPSPKKLMLASLAGCTGIDVVSILNKMKVEFSNFTIDVNAQLSELHPQIYQKVELIYTIQVKEIDKPKMERAVHLSKEKYCGVSAMFASFSTVKFSIVFL
jgi:putative redox protein